MRVKGFQVSIKLYAWQFADAIHLVTFVCMPRRRDARSE